MHVCTDHNDPGWIAALEKRGMRPVRVATTEVPCDSVAKTESAEEVPWMHTHYFTKYPPPELLVELCCHGCGEGLSILFNVPYDTPGPYPTMVYIRQAWSHTHNACGPKWRKDGGWYLNGLRSICAAPRSQSWKLRLDDVTGRNYF